MNINNARIAVYTRLVDNYTGVESSAITLDNEDFNEPINTPWLRLTVRTNARKQSTLGKPLNRFFRTRATAFIQVYTASNTGTGVGDVLATEAANLFEGVTFFELNFHSAIIRETGVSGKWYQHLVECVFNYYELK